MNDRLRNVSLVWFETITTLEVIMAQKITRVTVETGRSMAGPWGQAKFYVGDVVVSTQSVKTTLDLDKELERAGMICGNPWSFDFRDYYPGQSVQRGDGFGQ